MEVRVIDCQPFSRGGVVEGLVGIDERDRGETGILLLAVDFEGGGELDGVVGTQRVRVRQPRRLVQQGERDLDDGVTAVEMLAEAAQDRRRARWGERWRPSAAAGDGRGYFDDRDTG